MNLGILWSLSVLLSVSFAQQCLDENGKEVDWYILYKLPVITSSKDFLVRRGLAYIYITSKSQESSWTLSSLSINDSRSMPALTLSPLYSGNSSKFLYALYNDNPPNSSATLAFGHTKGVVITGSTRGLWLIHSAPRFPLEPVDSKTSKKNKYLYPATAARFGQTFLCISLPSDQMDVLGMQLSFNRPKVYSSNLPQELANQYKNLTLATKGQYIRRPPWSNKAPLISTGGMEFISYAKASGFGDDLYKWLASDLSSDLQVETWSNGEGELPSDCRLKYHVMDVSQLALKFNHSSSISFKNSQDHSKWAVTNSANKPIICIGDINRMVAQFKRGGGTLCMKNPGVWRRFSKLVQDVQPCPA